MGAAAPVLSTPRLILRPVAPVDGPELLALFRNPAVRRYLLDRALVDEAWVAEEVAGSVARFGSGSGGLWAVRVAAGPGTIVGFAGFSPFFEPSEPSR